MKSDALLTVTVFLTIFTLSVSGQINGDSVSNDDGNGNEGSAGGDDDFNEDYDNVEILINGDERVSTNSFEWIALMDYMDPEPKYIRQAEITYGPAGLYCVFWAPEVEVEDHDYDEYATRGRVVWPDLHTTRDFISPVFRTAQTVEESAVAAALGISLNKFQLHPEVPALPARRMFNFQLTRPETRVVVLLEIESPGSGWEDISAVLLYVDLNWRTVHGERLTEVRLDGSAGQFSLNGYPAEPNVRRARVLAAPYLERTVCVVRKVEASASFLFTSDWQDSRDIVHGAELLRCVEAVDEEEEAGDEILEDYN